MKIEIDFDSKTIEVKDQTTLGELVDKLKELNLKDWKEYKLKAQIVIDSRPWYVPMTQPIIYPLTPWYEVQPSPSPFNPPYTITCSGDEKISDLLTVIN